MRQGIRPGHQSILQFSTLWQRCCRATDDILIEIAFGNVREGKLQLGIKVFEAVLHIVDVVMGPLRNGFKAAIPSDMTLRQVP